MKNFIVTLSGMALIHLSCSGDPPQLVGNRNGGDLSIGRSPSNITLTLAQSAVYDGYDYTFGVQAINLDSSGKGTFVLSALALNGSLEAGEEELLVDLCSDVSLGTDPQTPALTDSIEIDSAKPLYVFWRSHYPAAAKQDLTPLVSRASIHCRLTLELQGDKVDIILNPVPSDASVVVGTSKPQDAIDEVLMMVDAAITGTILNDNHPYQVIPISSPGDILVGVDGVNRNDLVLTEVGDEVICRFHTLNGQMKIGNPEDIQEFSYSVSAPQDITVDNITVTSSGGRELQACGSVGSSLDGTNFGLEISCGAFMEVQTQGQGDSCGYYAGISNNQDPKNSVALGLRMSTMNFESIDIGNPVGSYKVIRKQAKNPISLNTVDVSSFNPVQQLALERSFDYWIGASPVSYTSFWEGNIARINYLGNSNQCNGGILAYVESLDTDEMFWCPLAGMRNQDLTEQGSPLVLMLISVTALHENLHAIGRPHDFDNRNENPCKGTSESAVISFDTVINCKEDSCFAMKDLAIAEYIFELDYSLQGDNRRFQGQCKTWNDALGLTANSFQT